MLGGWCIVRYRVVARSLCGAAVYLQWVFSVDQKRRGEKARVVVMTRRRELPGVVGALLK